MAQRTTRTVASFLRTRISDTAGSLARQVRGSRKRRRHNSSLKRARGRTYQLGLI
jgi:hypothetical protein